MIPLSHDNDQPNPGAVGDWLCSARYASDWNAGPMAYWKGRVSRPWAGPELGSFCIFRPPRPLLTGQIGFVLHNCPSSPKPCPTRRHRELGSFRTFHFPAKSPIYDGRPFSRYPNPPKFGFVSHNRPPVSAGPFSELGSFCTIAPWGPGRAPPNWVCFARFAAKLGSFRTIGIGLEWWDDGLLEWCRCRGHAPGRNLVCLYKSPRSASPRPCPTRPRRGNWVCFAHSTFRRRCPSAS
jgi:hypothetical protein